MKTMTEMLLECEVPFDNPYQGTDKRVVFVCSAGLLRSATAARIYAKKYNTRAAGSHFYALVPFNDALFLWAQEVVFMNQENFDAVKHHFDWANKPHKVLNIPDRYEHMNPKLIKAFEKQYEPLDD
jgi:predicted protein tyrosine phosphatase